MYKHFLVTRFNLRIDSWTTTKNGQAVLTNEWLHERFRLFEEFCLPSVRYQSDQNFTWCLFFDNHTSPVFKARAEKIANDYANIQLFYIEGIGELQSVFKSFIKEAVGINSGFIITTRLDNDDIIHRDFIKEVKSSFIPVHGTVIDLRSGLQISIEKEYAEIRKLCNAFNPFISLIEHSEKAETVLSRMHSEWSISKNVIIRDTAPLWIELVHGSNKLNHVYYSNAKIFSIDVSNYGLKERQIRFENNLKVLISNVGLWAKMKYWKLGKLNS